MYALSGASGGTLWSRNDGRTSAVLGFALETMDWNVDGTLDVVADAYGPRIEVQGVVAPRANTSTRPELVPAGVSDCGAPTARSGTPSPS